MVGKSFTHCFFNVVGSPSSTLAQHWNIIGWMPSVWWASARNAYLFAKSPYICTRRRRSRWANIDLTLSRGSWDEGWGGRVVFRNIHYKNISCLWTLFVKLQTRAADGLTRTVGNWVWPINYPTQLFICFFTSFFLTGTSELEVPGTSKLGGLKFGNFGTWSSGNFGTWELTLGCPATSVVQIEISVCMTCRPLHVLQRVIHLHLQL